MAKRHARKEIQDWRRFELMVTQLERALRSTQCIFRSPDFLVDHETGGTREVDCSITFPGLDAPRISIECRKRGAREDVTWIEQLATKRRALRLVETIAVSSRGFSAAAYRKAQHHAISLNTYKEVALALAERPLAIYHTRLTWTLKKLSYEISDDLPELPHEEVHRIEASIANAERDTAILRVISCDSMISLGQLIDHVSSRIDVTIDKPRRRLKIGFFEPTTLTFMSEPIPLLAVHLELEESRTTNRVDDPVFGTYSGAAGTLLQVARATCAQHQLTLLFQVLDQ